MPSSKLKNFQSSISLQLNLAPLQHLTEASRPFFKVKDPGQEGSIPGNLNQTHLNVLVPTAQPHGSS